MELKFPLAVAAMDLVSQQGAATHPGEQVPWPPDYSDLFNLQRADVHLAEYVVEGKPIDEHGINMLAKVMWRVAAVIERQARKDREPHEKQTLHRSRGPTDPPTAQGGAHRPGDSEGPPNGSDPCRCHIKASKIGGEKRTA